MSQTPCWITLNNKRNATEDPVWVPLRTFQIIIFFFLHHVYTGHEWRNST